MEKNGIIETYYSDSKKNIHTRIEYKDNKKNGIYEVYNEKGDLILKTNYKNDMKNGDYILYYDKNNNNNYNKILSLFKGEQKEELLYYRCKTTFIEDKVNGLKTTYFQNGQIEEICYYNDDLPHGQYKKYDESGKMIETSYWNYGKRTSLNKIIQKEFIEKVYPELIRITWHPKRVIDWCLSADDL